ncbi:MAG: glycosyltransferase family 2 protein [Phycisphaerae bacterium]|nr:glycosyltransferase family 2 protein [Gemmatimonadaceae bacterium]
MSDAPLLSVCVPTYQRAGLLRVMLQALMPQAAQFGAQVEVCIADNASTDITEAVVAEAAAAHAAVRVHYLKREQNVGPVRNYVYCATQQATGEYVWALGDDDLLLPGALRRVVEAIRSNRHLDFFYANFAAANFQAHWPESAVGGYGGEITELACSFLQNRHVRYWQELLDSSSSMGTQVYAHIVRRSVWTEFWHARAIAPDYRSLESTYPHTCMLIDKAWDKPAYYLGAPHLVQFNGRAGWADGNGTRIALVSLPQFVSRLDDRGLGLHALIRARGYLKDAVMDGFRNAVSGRGGPDAGEVMALSLAMGDRYPEMLEALLIAIQETGGHVVPEVVDVVRDALSRLQHQQSGGAATAA